MKNKRKFEKIVEIKKIMDNLSHAACQVVTLLESVYSSESIRNRNYLLEEIYTDSSEIYRFFLWGLEEKVSLRINESL